MRFLVDANLPPGLARRLAEDGHAAEHVADCGLATAKDRPIWDRAVATRVVVVTRDEDFARRRLMRSDGPQIVWLRHPNVRRRELLAWFADVMSDMLAALERGEAVVEITRDPID